MDLKSSNSSQQEMISAIDEKIFDLEATKSSLQAELEENKAKIANQEKLLNSMQELIATKDAKIAEQSSLIIQLESEKESKSAENENLKKEVKATSSSLQVVIRAKNVKITEQKKLHNSLVSELKSELESTLADNEKLKNELESTKSSLQEANITIASLVKNNEPLTKSVDEKENEHITETTIRATINDVSKISRTFANSQSTRFAGFLWRFRVRRYNNRVSVHLITSKPETDRWSCSAVFNLKLVSQKDASVVHTLGNQKWSGVFTDEICSWGFTDFISIQNLFDEEMGFVKNDSIIVAADIKIFPSK